MALKDAIIDLPNEDVLELFKQLRAQVLQEVKVGGRRRTSVAGEGQSVTYDLDGIRPAVAVRIVRKELVRRGCLPGMASEKAYFDHNPCPRACCDKIEDCQCIKKDDCTCKDTH